MDDKRIISFDWVVKRMLRNKANFAVLEGLFKVLIGRDMRIEEILESEGNQQDATALTSWPRTRTATSSSSKCR